MKNTIILLTVILFSTVALSQKKEKIKASKIVIFVGVAGFEPAASCSQSRRDNRATLHPEAGAKIILILFLQNDFTK
jgi:hypothetical protein